MPTNKLPFTFHLDEDVLRKVKIIAKAETRAQVIFWNICARSAYVNMKRNMGKSI